MKIALAQLNPVIGDYQKNCQKILHYARQAAADGCGLVIFPELAISGYPPQDLLQYPDFVAAQREAIAMLQQHLVAMDLPLALLLGCFAENNGGSGKPSSSALLLQGDEQTHAPAFCPVGDRLFAVALGEDISAVVEKREKKLDAIINIAATPFLVEKEFSPRLFTKICKKTGLPLLHCNQAGGQDSLVFAGGSLAMNGEGEVVAQARFFAEDMVIVDLDCMENSDIFCSETVKDSLSLVHDALVTGLRDYVRKCGFTQVVLGLSGGIDSAVTAALAVEALGAENVLGVALPSIYSSDESVIDARQLARNLGCRFEVLPIGDLFQHYKEELHPLFIGYEEDVTEQNLQARIRGNLLMAVANKFNAILLNTGNKSELAVGYSTLYGDMCGGLAVIADLSKGMVYEMAEYINRNGERIPRNTIAKAPSAELKPGQKDQDELPPYDILDQIVELYLGGGGKEAIVATGFDQAVVEDVLRRIRINEYKRKQAPPGLKITILSFTGRHYPTVHNYRG